MKKIICLIFLLGSINISFAEEEKKVFIHMHPAIGEDNIMVVKYVLCQGSELESNAVKCKDPVEKSASIPASGNVEIKIPNKQDYSIIATTIELEGKKIWGDYPVDFYKNICNTERGNDSLSFFLNGKNPHSVTCLPGMG